MNESISNILSPRLLFVFIGRDISENNKNNSNYNKAYESIIPSVTSLSVSFFSRTIFSQTLMGISKKYMYH